MGILSIQSWVSYGYVGNKAAIYPLQSLGFDVWPVNTVQFSNHTGYGFWKGEVFDPSHIQDIINGIKSLEVLDQCQAILTGYLGNPLIGSIIEKTVYEFKEVNPNVIYLCDPVMGDRDRGFFVKEGIPDYFQKVSLTLADIMTPNHFEAEILWGNPIRTLEDARTACQFFHEQGVKIVAITSFAPYPIEEDKLYVFLSTLQGCYLGQTPYLPFHPAPNGTGDLFSALFLGHFLKFGCPFQALEKTLHGVYGILYRTFHQNNREIQIFGSLFEHTMQGVDIYPL